eukprot:s946_g7.t1
MVLLSQEQSDTSQKHALCDVLVPLETILEWRQKPLSHDSDGVRLLDKLRWDLRVASGADLGDHDKRHLAKHEALYAAVSSLAAPDAAARMKEGKQQCVRSRLYFSHNSQLSGLLHLMLTGLLHSKASPAKPASSPPDCSPEASAEVASSFGSDAEGLSASGYPAPQPEVRSLYAQRLGFLSHFIVRLWRKRSDASLRVTCDVSPTGSYQTRVRLFDLPFTEVDSQWSEVLEPVDYHGHEHTQMPRGVTPRNGLLVVVHLSQDLGDADSPRDALGRPVMLLHLVCRCSVSLVVLHCACQTCQACTTWSPAQGEIDVTCNAVSYSERGWPVQANPVGRRSSAVASPEVEVQLSFTKASVRCTAAKSLRECRMLPGVLAAVLASRNEGAPLSSAGNVVTPLRASAVAGEPDATSDRSDTDETAVNNSVAILATLTLWSLTQQTASRLPQGIALMIQECSSRVDWALKLNGAAFVGCLAMYPLIAAKITQDLDFARRLRLYDAMQPPGDVWCRVARRWLEFKLSARSLSAGFSKVQLGRKTPRP